MNEEQQPNNEHIHAYSEIIHDSFFYIETQYTEYSIEGKPIRWFRKAQGTETPEEEAAIQKEIEEEYEEYRKKHG